MSEKALSNPGLLNPIVAAGTAGSDSNLLKPVVATEAAGSNSNLLKTIVATETAGSEKSILGVAPELDLSLLNAVGSQKSILLLCLKILFGLLIFAGLSSLAFFTSQLTDKLDFVTSRFDLPQVSRELASSNTEIISLQTDLNFNRYLQIKAALDRFSYGADEFQQLHEIANSQTASGQDKKKAAEQIKKLKGELKKSFLQAGSKFAPNFAAPLIDTNFSEDSQLQTLYEERLRNMINEKVSTLTASPDVQTRHDFRNYQQMLKLINNAELKNLLIQTDFDSLKDTEIYDLIKKINSLILNDLTVINEIKSKRIKWSDIINEIDLRTMAVDSHFDENFFNDLGGIRYNSYDFDTSSRTISISGETKTLDTATFTMIADLVDELNQSRIFGNAEMRSFSKSGSPEEGYKSSLNLTFDLKENKTTEK